jgi:hypothetical protein
MSMDMEGLQEMLSNVFLKDTEIERTIPSCDTCLHEKSCKPDERHYHEKYRSWCDKFIPKSWREHVLIAGEWWSQ